MKKIVIASDSFKGSLSSMEVCDYIEKGVLKACQEEFEIKKIPIADGGEGTVNTILFSLGGDIIKTKTRCPMGNSIESFYGMTDKNKAVIEMAAASGLALVPKDKRDPLFANTFGVGELILKAVEKGAKDILIGIGGSATNDFGIGMAKALGYIFLDENRNEIDAIPSNMIKIKHIDKSNVNKKIFDTNITIISDVSNQLYGENGATSVYGKQKGVDETNFDILENGIKNMAYVIKKELGKDVAFIEGSGAGGGLGGALIAFSDAKMKRGIDFILDIINFDDIIKDASLIITGEGSIDIQTKNGKVPAGIAMRAKKYNIPVIAVVGSMKDGSESIYELGITSIMPSVNAVMTLEEAIKNAPKLIEDAAFRAMSFIKINI